MTLILSFLTAIAFGAGDFFGGIASRRTPSAVVAFYSQGFAGAGLLFAALVSGTAPVMMDLLWGAGGGLAAGFAISRYYNGLSKGGMGWVATIVGVFSALLPFSVGVLMGERPSALSIIGIFTIVCSLIFVVRKRGQKLRSTPLGGIRNAIVSGLFFGLTFVCFGMAPMESPWWLIAAAGITSMLPLLRGRSLAGVRSNVIYAILAAGFFQGLALFTFSLAVTTGLLSIVSIAGALSPVGTAILARIFLKEQFSQRQMIGLSTALAGIVMLLLG